MKHKTSDFFADIATSLPGKQRHHLQAPSPAAVPDLELPLAGATVSNRVPAPRITTFEEMQAALAELREKHHPFLQNLAPELPSTRDRLEFKTFSWRIEQPEDRQNFATVLQGAGLWQTVEIPHYGPPLGQAATLYRCEFELPSWAARHEAFGLCFGGVDYRCQIYVNSLCIGTHEGFFEEFRLDCTAALKPGQNVLLVRVENDFTMLGENIGPLKSDGDKIYAATGLGYDEPELGWHHCPAGMGIWNTVAIEGTSRLYIDDLWVRPLPETHEIEIHAEVESRSQNFEEEVLLDLSIFGQNFQAVALRNHIHRGEAPFVRGFGDLAHGFDEVFPEILGSGRNYIRLRVSLPDARLWSPDQPWLYQLQACLREPKGNLLDARKTQFGMRSFTQDENSEPKGKFHLNGQEIRLRGANTMGNFERCIMRGDLEGLCDQILLAKLTNMNFLRMTQRPVHREFYEFCDRLGLMVQTDLPLFSTIRRSQFAEVARQAGCMERHVRRHCSNILVSFINEPRPAAGSKPHRFVHRDEMESLFEMAARQVRFHNPDRVVKYLDGDYDPPSPVGLPDNHVYCGWYIGHGIDLGALHQGRWLPVKPGWHCGCGEFGAEGLDSYAVMASEYPARWKPLSPDAPWNPGVIAMSQTWKFHRLWYEPASTAQGWIEASQDFQEWIIGMMTRSFRRMPCLNSFAVHLFIDAWPAGWMKAIMDSHCIPKKAWFAYRDALSPLAVSLRCDRTHVWAGERVAVEVWVCNDHPEARSGLTVHYELLVNGTILTAGKYPAEAPACAPVCLGLIPLQIPEVDSRSRLELGITLEDASGRPVHSHELAFEAFPIPTPATQQVWTPQANPATQQFLKRLALAPVDLLSDSDMLLLTNISDLEANREQIESAVRKGATAVLLNLPPGEHRLGHAELRVREAGMGPRHFVSRATGHCLVEGFHPNDFRFWFHESAQRVAPILTTVLDAAGWTPILLTGDGGWTKDWEYYPAAAEIRDGQGLWRVCQLPLSECIRHNPTARIFAQRLFRHKTRKPIQTHPIPSDHLVKEVLV